MLEEGVYVYNYSYYFLLRRDKNEFDRSQFEQLQIRAYVKKPLSGTADN